MLNIKKIWFLPFFTFSFCIGCSKPSPKNEITFANDSWANVINYANEGIDSLVNHYHPSGNTFVILPSDSTEDIENKTRKVNIDGYGTFDVRVIGECMNAVDGKNTKAATLTFEFVDCVTCSEINPLGSSNYKNSPIRAFLNTNLINKFPLELKSNLLPVVNQSYDRTELIVYTDKLFLPTVFETQGNDATQNREGEAYPFHFLNRKYKYSAKRLNDYQIPYWTRSMLDTDETLTQYYAISRDGQPIIKKSSEILGISPLFAIGINDRIKSLYLNASNASFYESIRYAIDTPSISNTIKFNSFKFSDGQDLPVTSIKKKPDVSLILDGYVGDSRQIDHFDKTTGKFTVDKIMPDIKTLVFNVNPLHFDVSLDKIEEIAEFDENNNFNGEFARKYINIGDYYDLKKYSTLDNLSIEVIGYGHDTYTINGETKSAALSFDTRYSSISYVTNYDDQDDNSSYANSKVHSYLNLTNSPNCFLDIIKGNGERFYQNLKVCNKSIYQSYGAYDANTWKIVNLPSKVWLLSASEINIVGHALIPSTYELRDDNFLDGHPYDYYQILPYGTASYQKRADSRPPFKLRTPYLSDSTRTNSYLICAAQRGGFGYDFVSAIQSTGVIMPSIAV